MTPLLAAASGLSGPASVVLTIAGLAALIMIHETGHFLAAKAVGMRVERLYLFFGRTPLHFRRGETEYGIGWLPAGGYAKISGMTPLEELPPDVAPRAFHRQKVWKRILVIAAGPAANVLAAFVIFFAVLLANGELVPTNRVGAINQGTPAQAALRLGDQLVAVDGRSGSVDVLRAQIASHRCAGTPTAGCAATTPVRLTVIRAGRRLALAVTPRYSAADQRTEVGFGFATKAVGVGPGHAASLSARTLWDVTSQTGRAIAHIFQSKQRKQLSGVVGIYEVTKQSFASDLSYAFDILGLVSVSLALVNLLPFLPLDGGHIFWALAEKLRGRPVPFSVMERASVVGIVLVVFLAIIGFSNDLSRLNNGGFKLR